MGSSSIITNAAAPADGLFQNAACKYYEVDQTVFEEKLELRGKESGRHLPSSESQRPEVIDSADDEPEEVPRERSSSPSPATQQQSRGCKLSRSPPCDQQDCGATSSTKRSNKTSSRKSSSSNTGSKDRHHSLMAEKRIPRFTSN